MSRGVRFEVSDFNLFLRYEFIVIDEALIKKFGRTATFLKYLDEKVGIRTISDFSIVINENKWVSL